MPDLIWVDTHCHLYSDKFSNDRHEMMQRAIEAGVAMMLLPDIDASSTEAMMALHADWPHHTAMMMGVHPCSIDQDHTKALAHVEKWLSRGGFVAVGEIGLDYYWDKTYTAQQREAYRTQLLWAMELGLPVSIHARESNEDCIRIAEQVQDGRLRGVFHCFSGSLEQARRIEALDMHLGIGGVATYGKTLRAILPHIPLERLVLETDAPYLTPAPYRGQRNESGYLPIVGRALAELYDCPVTDIAGTTTLNARQIFKTVSWSFA